MGQADPVSLTAQSLAPTDPGQPTLASVTPRGELPDALFFDRKSNSKNHSQPRVAWLIDVVGMELDVGIEELDQGGAPLGVQDSYGLPLFSSEGDDYRQTMLAPPGNSLIQQPEHTQPPIAGPSASSNFSLDATPFSFNRSQRIPDLQTPQRSGQSNVAGCSCLGDLLGVMQHLDEDAFKITTLAMDQVLQLQKWIIFQCCRPLDCSSCLGQATVTTVLCDRLTEMFECLYKRLKVPAPNAIPEPPTDGSSVGSPWSHQSAVSATSAPVAAQLFDSTGQAASRAACNPILFSQEFRNQYSDEEQIHMIRVLLRLQIRNFRQLLLRLQDTIDVAANQARKSKVKSLKDRLTKASTDLDNALHSVLQSLSVG